MNVIHSKPLLLQHTLNRKIYHVSHLHLALDLPCPFWKSHVELSIESMHEHSWTQEMNVEIIRVQEICKSQMFT